MNTFDERLARANAWLDALDPASPAGHYDIDGDELFANIFEVDPVDAADKDYEFHKAYADIHMPLQGSERIDVATLTNPNAADFNEKDDFGLSADVTGASTHILQVGERLCNLPFEAHKPALKTEPNQKFLKKVCVKIKVD